MLNRAAEPRQRGLSWRVRAALFLLILAATVTVVVTNSLLYERFTETTRNRAELRLALYSGNLLAELRQNAIVPQLLARDPELIDALSFGEFSKSSARLISFVDEIGAASLMMLDADGRTVAATDRNRIGSQHRSEPYFIEALRGNTTIFTAQQTEAGNYTFTYARRVKPSGEVIGVIVAEVDLQKFESAWAGITDALVVTDNQGAIILATEPRWRGKTEDDALTDETPQGAIQRAIQATADWTTLPPDTYV